LGSVRAVCRIISALRVGIPIRARLGFATDGKVVATERVVDPRNVITKLSEQKITVSNAQVG
jgi:hypothetical protein